MTTWFVGTQTDYEGVGKAKKWDKCVESCKNCISFASLSHHHDHKVERKTDDSCAAHIHLSFLHKNSFSSFEEIMSILTPDMSAKKSEFHPCQIAQ